ncbi:hypothetical protein [Gordonia aichiensis]
MQLSAPLVDYVPLSLELSVPCTALRDLTGATVLTTVPPEAPPRGTPSPARSSTSPRWPGCPATRARSTTPRPRPGYSA